MENKETSPSTKKVSSSSKKVSSSSKKSSSSIKKQNKKKQNTNVSKKNEYMNKRHIEEFRQLLLGMLENCNNEMQEAILIMRMNEDRFSDQVDMSDIAQRKEEARYKVNRLVYRKAEIEAALRRLEDGEYGYCEETGEEIGLERLRANPLARFSVEAANRIEHMNKLNGKFYE